MPEYRFETHSPVNLVVEISKGNVNVRCTETEREHRRRRGQATPRRSWSSSTAARSP